MTSFLTAFLIACALTLLATPLVIELCRRFQLFDHPSTGHKRHGRSIPHLGGVAVFVGFFTPVIGLLLVDNRLADKLHAALDSLSMFFVASALILALGVFDDIRGANAWIKFPIQGLATLLIYHAGSRIDVLAIPFLKPIELGWLSLPLTLLWVVGVTNAVNLIDGIDGLASGVGFFASSTLFFVCLIPGQGDDVTALFMAALAGSLLGFIRYNFSPASIFLGDSGSLLVGFAIAVLSIHGSQVGSSAMTLAIPVVVLGLPIFDTVVAMVRRYFRGDSMFVADRQHIHHKLIDLGLSTKRAVLVLYGVCCALAIAGLALLSERDGDVALILVLVSVAAFIVGRKLGYLDMILGNIRSGQGLPSAMRNKYSKRLLGQFQERLQTARTTAQIWEVVCHALDGLDFDRAELLVHTEGGLPLPDTAPLVWQRSDSAETAESPLKINWSAEIAIRKDGKRLGELIISRDVDRATSLPAQREWLSGLGELLAEELDRVHGPHSEARSEARPA